MQVYVLVRHLKAVTQYLSVQGKGQTTYISQAYKPKPKYS